MSGDDEGRGADPTRSSPETEVYGPPAADTAREASRSHRVSSAPGRSDLLFDRLKADEGVLEAAYRHCAREYENQVILSSAAEWLLDNYHIVLQAAREAREDLPEGYYRQLPKLQATALEGYPRVYAVGRLILGVCSARLRSDVIEDYVRSYQETAPLTIGEIWALPTMLRLATIGILARAAARTTGTPEDAQQALPETEGLLEGVPDDDLVANAIVSLRLLDTQNWNAFFDSVSLVERRLHSDPAGVYGAMDFETRDRYRKEVEDLARASGSSEMEVAELAVQLALEHRLQKSPADHVGHYLIGEARHALELRVSYKPVLSMRARRWILEHPELAYLSPIGMLSAAIVFLAVGYGWWGGSGSAVLFASGVLASVPALTVAVGLVNWIVTRAVPPRLLPKMDFERGIPDWCRTAVVVPSVLAEEGEIRSLLQQIELHYLANPDPNLSFALLTDFSDAAEQTMPEDGALVETAAEGIRRLNERYAGNGRGPFHLYHRERRWNPHEGAWMGWERKRGKLQEFNRLLLGKGATSYTVRVGDGSTLSGTRYVITLDADTILPKGGARRLVETFSHPLNRPAFEPGTARVVSGYTILQPRTQVQPTSAARSILARTFAGDAMLDLYTLAISDVYQDLFGEGIYVGKGIYHVEAFERSLSGKVPENALLSHDLFEGINGRAALVTDVVLYEDYPSSYSSYAVRLHRWVRGDWQLLPWLFRSKGASNLSLIDRWKIVDNLRRSLLAPALFALLLGGWTILPGAAALWTLAAVLTPAVPILTGAAAGLLQALRTPSSRRIMRPLRTEAVRWLLAIVLLPREALLMADAILTTLLRLTVTHRHLLRWVQASHAEKLFGTGTKTQWTWRQVLVALITFAVLGLLVLRDPGSLPAGLPLIFLWMLSPFVAHWISRPIRRPEVRLSEEQKQALRKLARRTWHFFEEFVTPEDFWLPPDHFQESPRGLVAHRTSPTNIGLMLLSTMAAFDFGYIGVRPLSLRVLNTLRSMEGLERYRGHFLNWYDTRTLEQLPPRYVSTVDSGNLAACLLALRQGCLEAIRTPIHRRRRWEGLLDTLSVLDDVVQNLAKSDADAVAPLEEHLASIREQGLNEPSHPETLVPLLERLTSDESAVLKELLSSLLLSETHELDPDAVGSLRRWVERFRFHLRAQLRELNTFLPWQRLLAHPPSLFAGDAGKNEAWQQLVGSFPRDAALENIPGICVLARARLADVVAGLAESGGDEDQLKEAGVWCARLTAMLKGAQKEAADTLERFKEVSERAEAFFDAMDFAFLFDRHRQVFHIGYHVDGGALDDNHYDLLASEARVASLVAVAKNDVPQSHWLHLGRPLAMVGGMETLISWSGTMFEYLMPVLLLRHYENTLLRQSCQAAVDHQIRYAGARDVPWGISESGYYMFDADMSYQYRAFGVPELGYKRGLEKDLVVSPYASMLALPFRPAAVAANIEHLAGLEALGDYGFYEALDYTSSRISPERRHALVASYMTHHQSMTLVSLANYLMGDPFVRRFHSDPRIHSIELLLQEQIPRSPIEERPPEVEPALEPRARKVMVPWRASVQGSLPSVHFLSNGRYGVLITSAGGGYSTWNDLALTRWRADTTLDDWGAWIYVQDMDENWLWSCTHQPIGASGPDHDVLFYPHKAEFSRRDRKISLRMEVVVSPDEDVEIRRITVTNEDSVSRRLRLTSYAEPVLADQDSDLRHPAFNKLFIESEFLPSLNALILHRRSRQANERQVVLGHALVVEGGRRLSGAHETDRARFLGRGRSLRAPAAVEEGGRLSGTTGATLDPIVSISQEIELAPHETTRMAFITFAAETREGAADIALRYRSLDKTDLAFDRARSQCEAELRRLDLTTTELEDIQKLLSVLCYPHRGLRSEARTLVSNKKGQSGLWPFAISGDYPILLVRMAGEEDTKLVSDVLKAHTYWRDRQLKIDVVVLKQKESGYAQTVEGRIRRILVHTGSAEWLHRRGGIFLIRKEQTSEADRTLLATAARAVLDAGRGSLGRQLEALTEHRIYPPVFIPSLTGLDGGESTPPVNRPEHLLFDNGLGGFLPPDGREYVICLESGQSTPCPWVNVIANPRLGFIVSESGSSCTWAYNSGENRLTPWRNDPVGDLPGEALYLRDEETGSVWSPTPLPSGTEAPCLIRHGAGYTVFEHAGHGLRQRVTVYAAKDDPVKIIRLSLRNVLPRIRRITATYYAEWVLGTHRGATQAFIISEYENESGALLARNAYNEEFGEMIAFLAASKRPHGLTADRTEFLGRLGHLSRPAGLERIGLSSAVSAGIDPCGAIQLHMDLPEQGSEEIFFILGEGANRDDALRLIRAYQDPGRVETEWQAINDFWDDCLSAVSVETPDKAMDLLVNRWALYQTLSCRIWGRSGLYQSSGAYGFRDQLQDVMALVHGAPEIAREHILRAASRQFTEGDVLHWWHPPSGRGVRTRVSDDLLWLPYAAAHYVEATGDETLLKEPVPYLSAEPLEPEEEERYGHYEPAGQTGTLYDHCLRAIGKASTSGPHGLPLIGTGDWNDGLNRVGVKNRGESVWLGWFSYAVLDAFLPLCRRLGDDEQASSYEDRMYALRDALEESAWDGRWYLRAFYDDGAPLGSAGSGECQIDSIAQSWAVLSGAAGEERMRRAMESIDDRLVRSDQGLVLLLAPPYDRTPRDPGYIKGYPPGIRENGGQYTHAAIWTVWAWARLGRGDRAADLFRMINPIYHGDTAEKVQVYRVEPYVMAGDVGGLTPHTGRGGWTWYTGSAGWMYRLAVEGLLGLRRTGRTLQISPCVPRSWKAYSASYRYGRSIYRIRVDNPDGVSRGVEALSLDGRPLPTGELLLEDDQGSHEVVVRMG